MQCIFSDSEGISTYPMRISEGGCMFLQMKDSSRRQFFSKIDSMDQGKLIRASSCKIKDDGNCPYLKGVFY